MKRIHLYLALLLLPIIACTGNSSSKENEHIGDEINANVPQYFAPFVNSYFRLESIQPYNEGFFKIEKLSGEVFYTIQLDYSVKMLSDEQKKQFYHVTGEDKCNFAQYDYKGPTRALAHMIDCIDITSNAAFNGLAAGESLRSKFSFLSASAWPAIQKGKTEQLSDSEMKATEYFRIFNSYLFDDTYAPVQGLLTELGRENLSLLECAGANGYRQAVLVAREIPEIKTHIFTIKFTEGKKTWSVDIPAAFE